MLRHLAETGGFRTAPGRPGPTRLPADQLAIPEGVRDVVGRRLSRLSDDANQALRLAAVVGAEFELGVVRAAGDLDEEALLAAIEEAAAGPAGDRGLGHPVPLRPRSGSRHSL